MTISRGVWGVLLSSAGLWIDNVASASESTAVADSKAQPALEIQEVIVTARKREERLQDVPISIAAISGKELTDRGFADVASLSNATPNLEINNGRADGGGSTAQIYIRGVGQNDFLIPNDPGVGLYVDDVYVSRSSGAITGLMDLQSVEVLRGPQGTLYGKNTIGGAVRITSAKPSLDTESGRFGVTVGTYQRHDFNGSINLPVTDELAIRVAGSSRSTDDIGHRVLDPSGAGTGNINETATRIQALYEPLDRLQVLVTGDYTRTRQHGPYGANSGYIPGASPLIDALNSSVYPAMAASLGLPAGSQFDGRWVSSPKIDYGTGPNQDDFDVSGISAVVSYSINSHLSLKSISAYRTVRSTAGRDGDHSPFPVLETIVKDDNEQYSQEFQLNGTYERFNWTTGLYYLKENLKDTYDAKLWDGLIDSPVAVDFDAHSLSRLHGTSLAAFGQGTYNLTSSLHLTLGGRFNREQKDFYEKWYFLVQPREFTCPGIDVSGQYDNCKSTDNVFTPAASLSFNVSSDALLYFSYSEGFKAGGWTPRLFSQQSLRRDSPERLKAFELGIKSEWFDRRLVLNADAFYSKYRDLQLTSVLADSQGNPQPVVENAGAARITGGELEATAKLTRTTTFDLAVGVIDAKYTYLDPGVSFGIHNKLPDTPPVSLNAALRQDFPIPDGALISLRVDASYKGKTYKDPDNSPRIIQDPYALVNARLTYRAASGKWETALFGTNLANKQYLVSGLDLASTFGFVESYYGRPREAGIDLNIYF
jgi:iron complex outermembrane receptor protein